MGLTRGAGQDSSRLRELAEGGQYRKKSQGFNLYISERREEKRRQDEEIEERLRSISKTIRGMVSRGETGAGREEAVRVEEERADGPERDEEESEMGEEAEMHNALKVTLGVAVQDVMKRVAVDAEESAGEEETQGAMESVVDNVTGDEAEDEADAVYVEDEVGAEDQADVEYAAEAENEADVVYAVDTEDVENLGDVVYAADAEDGADAVDALEIDTETEKIGRMENTIEIESVETSRVRVETERETRPETTKKQAETEQDPEDARRGQKKPKKKKKKTPQQPTKRPKRGPKSKKKKAKTTTKRGPSRRQRGSVEKVYDNVDAFLTQVKTPVKPERPEQPKAAKKRKTLRSISRRRKQTETRRMSYYKMKQKRLEEQKRPKRTGPVRTDIIERNIAQMNRIKEKKRQMLQRKLEIQIERDVGFGYKKHEAQAPRQPVKSRRRLEASETGTRHKKFRYQQLKQAKQEVSRPKQIFLEMEADGVESDDRRRSLIRKGLSRLKQKSRLKDEQKHKMRELKGLLDQMDHREPEAPPRGHSSHRKAPGRRLFAERRQRSTHSRRSTQSGGDEAKTYGKISQQRRRMKSELVENYGELWGKLRTSELKRERQAAPKSSIEIARHVNVWKREENREKRGQRGSLKGKNTVGHEMLKMKRFMRSHLYGEETKGRGPQKGVRKAMSIDKARGRDEPV